MRTCVIIFTLLILGACSPKNNSKENTTTSNKQSNLDKGNNSSKLIDSDSVDLTKHGIKDNPNNVLGGLQLGEVAPNFELEDQNGKLISLYEELEEGPVLLIFYRADWCSICVRHLSEFQDKINDLGESNEINVLAISPQLQEYSLKLKEENNYSFPILYDNEHQTMKDYKVFFHVTEKYNQYITEVKGDPIEVRNGNKEPVMPVPATYMIGKDRRLKFVHYDPNYRVRGNIDEALQSLNG